MAPLEGSQSINDLATANRSDQGISRQSASLPENIDLPRLMTVQFMNNSDEAVRDLSIYFSMARTEIMLTPRFPTEGASLSRSFFNRVLQDLRNLGTSLLEYNIADSSPIADPQLVDPSFLSRLSAIGSREADDLSGWHVALHGWDDEDE